MRNARWAEGFRRSMQPHLMGRMTGAPCTTVADALPDGVLVPCRMQVGNAAASAGGKMRRTSPAKLSGLYVVGGRASLGVLGSTF